MQFFQNTFKLLQKLKPTPFKSLQKKLQIEEEWMQFKNNFRPHKYKFVFVTGLVLLPYYKPILNQIYESSILNLSSILRPNQPFPQVAESFGKELITGIFNDDDVKRESGYFVQDLVKQQLVLDAVVELLIKTLKDDKFNDETQIFSKQLLDDLLEDKKVQEGILRMLLKLLRDPEFKAELQIAVKELFSADSTVDAVGDLLSESIQKQQVKKAAGELTSDIVQQLLLNKDIEEKLKIYFYYFFEREDVKKLIDKLLQRAVKGGKIQESKQSEFDKLMQQNDSVDIYENIRQRLAENDSNNNPDKQKRFFFF